MDFLVKKQIMMGIYAFATATNTLAGITWDTNTSSYNYWAWVLFGEWYQCDTDNILIIRSDGFIQWKDWFSCGKS